MLNGIEANQIYLFMILVGAILLLFTEWIRIDLTAILSDPHHRRTRTYRRAGTGSRSFRL
jgi:hypothetical protein